VAYRWLQLPRCGDWGAVGKFVLITNDGQKFVMLQILFGVEMWKCFRVAFGAPLKAEFPKGINPAGAEHSTFSLRSESATS
jgi:hypothetical protein